MGHLEKRMEEMLMLEGETAVAVAGLTAAERDSFADFARDHIKHFNAIPMEVEVSDGRVLAADGCRAVAGELGLFDLLREDEA